jgi:hypothetical protein
MGRYPRKSKDTVRLHTKTKIRDGQKTIGTNGLHRRQRTSYITALQRKKERKKKVVFVLLPPRLNNYTGERARARDRAENISIFYVSFA